MYAHPPRCSNTALPYTKQLKCRSYIFCFCWQLLTSYQSLIRHFGCFISFVIFLMALSFQSERHWIQPPLRSPITCSHVNRESTSRIMVPLQVFPPVAVTTDIHTFRDSVYHIFTERVKWKLSGQLFFFPSPCCKGGLSTLGREVLTVILHAAHTVCVK